MVMVRSVASTILKGILYDVINRLLVLRKEACRLIESGWTGCSTRGAPGVHGMIPQTPDVDGNTYIWQICQCGGAHARARPASLRRRRRRTGHEGPSNHTGAQTGKKRKPGSRVTSQGAFVGEGKMLRTDDNSQQNDIGTGFRKRAGR